MKRKLRTRNMKLLSACFKKLGLPKYYKMCIRVLCQRSLIKNPKRTKTVMVEYYDDCNSDEGKYVEYASIEYPVKKKCRYKPELIWTSWIYYTEDEVCAKDYMASLGVYLYEEKTKKT